MTVDSDVRRLSKKELESIHKSLIEITRKQKSQNTPVEIAMPEGIGFWNAVGQLLQNMEIELSETVRDEGMTAKAQLLSRRLGVARTCVTDLTESTDRIYNSCGYDNLLTYSNLQAPSNGFQRLEWSKHDPSERVFYNGVREQTDKYKISNSWSEMLGALESHSERIVGDIVRH